MTKFSPSAARGRLAGAVRAICLAAAALLVLPAAWAQQWPTRPVRIVIPFAAGSGGDILARSLAPSLESVWKQPVIVENRPGASGLLGTEYVAHATDGHTLLLGTQSSVMGKLTSRNLKFDPLDDLVPVYKLINYQMVILANAETARKAGSLQELIGLSKSSRELFFAGTGPASSLNMAMNIVNRSVGIRYTTVDFANTGAMSLSVLRGDAQFMLYTPGAVRGQIEAGQLKPIAALSTERYPELPDVPTLREAVGYEGYMPLLWAGIFVPKAMPAAAVDRIAKDLLAVTARPEVVATVEPRLAGRLVRSSPARFAKEIADEVAVWSELLAAMNFKPE